MKTILASLLLLLGLASASLAQQPSVSIPLGNLSLTPTPPPPTFTQGATVTVDQSVVFNGTTYKVTGTLTGNLTFTPSSTNASLPPLLGPILSGGQPIDHLTAGQMVQVQGSNFGVQLCRLDLDGLPAPIITWADREIDAISPYSSLLGLGIWATVYRSDGLWDSALLVAPDPTKIPR